jgi:GR25 family glycosyltransferase involved in LPS biosynthesis
MPDLIAHSELATLCQINSLVEARKTTAAIADAHRELKKVLGRTGYAIVYAAAPTFTTLAPNAAAYVTLLTDYIKPFMAWRAKQRATVDMFAEADRGGTYKKGGQDYVPVSASELSKIESIAQSRADSLLDDLIEHINENRSVFTWIDTNVENEERITDTNRTVAGVSFRRSERQDPYRG